ncbi:TPA: N-acetylmuramoyl-L-alanine amidase [Salmonella enterica subsp. enterica serovar Typhi str. AG3]|nr:N-acetylmuramoyl-L-alanine amidase [Salmonella enterica subsp. enterica serovar Typhi str. AG3]
MVKEIEIHPGHWKNTNSGANSLMNEVTEARKVAKRVHEILKTSNVRTTYLEDNSSTNQRDNINYLVGQHNKDQDGLIVSIHFNASGGTSNKGIGTEVLYYSEKHLAAKVAKAISDVSGLKNRGAKQRTDLGVLAKTYEPAILIEVCFVNDSVDVALYRRDFEKICQAIARELAGYQGKSIGEVKGSSITKEELTVAQYEELMEIIEAQAKRIEVLEAFAGVKERAVAPDHKVAWEWAQSQGLVNGKNPNRPLTREQFATIEYRKATKK